MSVPTKFIRYLPHVIGILVTVVLTYLAVQFLATAEEESPRKKVVQQVTVITLPPPPPLPEQEPEVQEPEEEEAVDEIDEAMPDEGMDEDIGNDLGLDTEGSAGGDGFGLLARKGGRGIIGGGYGALVIQEINALLIDDERLRHKEYTITLNVWISESGDIEQFEINNTSGDDSVNPLILSALTRLKTISEGPPLEIPQPIRLRIKSRI